MRALTSMLSLSLCEIKYNNIFYLFASRMRLYSTRSEDNKKLFNTKNLICMQESEIHNKHYTNTHTHTFHLHHLMYCFLCFSILALRQLHILIFNWYIYIYILLMCIRESSLCVMYLSFALIRVYYTMYMCVSFYKFVHKYQQCFSVNTWQTD